MPRRSIFGVSQSTQSRVQKQVSSAIKTASCRAVTIPCRNIAALSAARAEASARGGPPQGRAPQTSTRSYDNNRSSCHPQDDGTESLILQIAGRFCTRLVRSAEDKASAQTGGASAESQINLVLRSACTLCGGQSLRSDRRRLGRIPNKFGSALGLHTLRRTSLRLDRRRFGRIQINLVLRPACTLCGGRASA